MRFNNWIKTRWNVIGCIGAILCLCYGKFIFQISFYQDAPFILFEPGSRYNWLEIGRFGLVFIREIFGTNVANPYYTAILFLITTVLVGTLWGYLLDLVTHRKNPAWQIVLFVCIYLTYPVWSEQYYFQFQSFEIAFANLLVVSSLIYLYKGKLNKKIGYKILAIAMAILAFGIYQSMVNVYITGCLGMYLLSMKDTVDWKAFFREALEYIFIFLVMFICYRMLANKFTTSGYLAGQMAWGKEPLKEILKGLFYHFLWIWLGKSIFFPITYSILAVSAGVFSVIAFIKNKKNLCFGFLNIGVIGAVFLSPFLLTVVLGEQPVNRAHLALPLAIAFGFIYVLHVAETFCVKWKPYLQKAGLILGIVCCLMQVNNLARVMYTYDIIQTNDRMTATKLSYDLDKIIAEYGNLPVAFVGEPELQIQNSACADIEEFSYMFLSSFNQNINAYPYGYHSSEWTRSYYRMFGFNYTAASQEQVKSAMYASQEMPVWPDADGIKAENGVIIVKLGEMDLAKINW
ncbi:MAG: glucosyltransferase domain-containing protein [Lachnospiraceae bacterium]|nr:glucosyltransferase domain-containing protein [Lachnospiraceae bacterium]